MSNKKSPENEGLEFRKLINLPGGGVSIGTQAQIRRQSNTGRDIGKLGADDTAKSYQQEHGNGSGNRCSDYTALGNLHIKKPLQGYQKESALHREQPAGNGQPEQQQQVQRPSAYHESTIKTKEPVLHRKSDVPSGIKRTDDFSLKERKGKKEKSQKSEPAVTSKVHREKRAGESWQKTPSDNFSTANKVGNLSAGGDAQSFSAKRDVQISQYKKKKFFRSGKEKYSLTKAGKENIERKADIGKSTGTSNIPEAYRQEAQPIQMQGTGTGESALSQIQNNLSAENTSTSHIRKRSAGDSIRQRDKDISGRKDKAGRKDKKSKRDKGKNKDAKKDNSRSKLKSRKDRAAALRLLTYASDKFSQEEQKDSLLKVIRDLLVGKAKAAVAGKILSIGAALLPVLIPAFVMVLIITLLFNSPFSILLPKLSEEPGAVEVLAEYTEDFREKVQEELADPGRGDETELVYEDYEGDGEPDNMADILMYTW